MDFAKLMARVKAILITPKTEWPVIAAEPETVAGLYKNYILILAAIPAVFGFIKGSIIGFSLFGITARTPMVSGIIGMLVTYGNASGPVPAFEPALLAKIRWREKPDPGAENRRLHLHRELGCRYCRHRAVDWLAGGMGRCHLRNLPAVPGPAPHHALS